MRIEIINRTEIKGERSKLTFILHLEIYEARECYFFPSFMSRKENKTIFLKFVIYFKRNSQYRISSKNLSFPILFDLERNF